MSRIGVKAVRGVMWTIGASVGSRLIGVVGTLLITHFLAPEVVGEVGVATVLVLTMNRLSNIGFGQYVVATRAGPDATFHASIFALGLGVLGFGSLIFVAEPLGPVFDAPGMAVYMPGLVGGAIIQRVGFVASRVLARDMQFKVVALGLGLGEIFYTGVSVGLAIMGWGGDAIVMGNVARGLVQAVIYCAVADRREWLAPCRLTKEHSRDIFRFGLPLWVGSVANFASQRWDNLIFSRMFGTHKLGLYNLAYNLADIPSTHVGEHIGDVLLPSYAHMDRKQRRYALVQSTALMALVVFPLAVGLGAVAPTLVTVLFNEEWQGVAPMLLILSALSVVRPVGWTILSYLTALRETRAIMVIEIFKVIALLAAVALLGLIGPLWACAGVGVAFGLGSLASLWYVWRADQIPMLRILRGMAGPLVACGVLAAGVVGARQGFATIGLGPNAVTLTGEIIAGGLAYVVGAFLFAPSVAKNFLKHLKKALRRGSEEEEQD